MVSASDGWAVGYYQAQHWDGATWSAVPLPTPGSAFNGQHPSGPALRIRDQLGDLGKLKLTFEHPAGPIQGDPRDVLL